MTSFGLTLTLGRRGIHTSTNNQVFYQNQINHLTILIYSLNCQMQELSSVSSFVYHDKKEER